MFDFFSAYTDDRYEKLGLKYKKENESGLKNLSVSAWSEQKEDVICILFFVMTMKSSRSVLSIVSAKKNVTIYSNREMC